MMNSKWYSAQTRAVIGVYILLCQTAAGQYIPSGGGGNAATANALAGTPTQCSPGSFPSGIAPDGNAQGCATPAGTLGSVGSDVKTLGATCNGIADDSAAFQMAETTPETWYLPPNATCIVGDWAVSANAVHFIGNNTTIKHLTSDTANFLLYVTGADDVFYGLNLDENGVVINTAGAGNANGYNIMSVATNGASNVLFDHVKFLNSGNTSACPGTAADCVGAIGFYNTTGLMSNSEVDSSVPGDGDGTGQVLVQQVPSASIAMTLDHNTFSGGLFNQVYSRYNVVGATERITNNKFYNVSQQAGNLGQTGNAVVSFELSGKLLVADNEAYGPAYTGVRVNQTANHLDSCVISHNTVDGSGETGIYMEFGTEGCSVTGNSIIHGSQGIDSTNISSRTNDQPNTIVGNTIEDMKIYCLYEEHDTVMGNTCSLSPIGVEVGYGGTGYGNIAALNTFASVTLPIAVDSGLSATPNNQVGGNVWVGTNAIMPTARGVPIAFSSAARISGITQQNPAVVSFSSGTMPPLGSTVLISGVYGMTQINNQLCSVSAASASSFTCGGAPYSINSLGYSAYSDQSVCGVNNVCDAWPRAFEIYSTGTTLANSLPSTVVAIQ